MSKTDRIEARIESELKQAAKAVFSKLGVSPSDAIRIFYKQVELHQGFPFEVLIPNAETLAAIEEVKKHPERLKLLKSVVQLLVEEQPLPERYRDHNLVGDWSGYRDCHIEPDWLLLYKIERDEEILTLVRIGTHSDLFRG